MFRVVRQNIGIEKIELQPPHGRAPNLRDDFSVAQFNPHIYVWNQLHREGVKVILFKSLLLPSRRIQVLPEISFLIEQPYANQWQSQVARRLQVVAREHA